MRRLKTRLRIRKIFGFLAFALIFAACGEDQKSEKLVVKVNDASLTKSMLDSALSSKANTAKLRDEFVNDWIETEILYQEAVKEGILDDKEFNSILNRSKKELAGVYLINKLLLENDQTPSDEEVEKYYNDFKEDFKLQDDLYKLNVLRTNDYEKAVQARIRIIENGWDKGKDFFRTDSTLSFSSLNSFRSEISSALFLRVLDALLLKEVSVVLEIESGSYSLVQLVEKYPADSIAPFEIEKENAERRLTVLKKKEFVKEHIKKLVSEHNLEIERYTE